MTQVVDTAGSRHGLAEYVRAGRVPVVHQVIALATLFVVAVSRAPYVLTHGRFYAEEGSIYYPHMRDGSIWYVAKSVGYVYAFLNGATWLAARVPIEQAPLVTAWLSLALVMVVAWAALALPSDLLPNAGSRLAAAVLLVVGPVAVPVVWLNATNAQVYLGVLAVLFLFLDVGSLGRVQFGIVVTLLVLAGVSGLYAAVLAPAFVVLALRDRSVRRIVLAVAISACAVAQLVVVARSHASGDLAQGRGSFRGFGAITRDIAAWHFGSFLFGDSTATDLYQFARQPVPHRGHRPPRVHRRRRPRGHPRRGAAPPGRRPARHRVRARGDPRAVRDAVAVRAAATRWYRSRFSCSPPSTC